MFRIEPRAKGRRLDYPTLNNTGDCHTKLKSYKDAIACFSECLSLLNREDTFMYSVVTCNLGEVYFCNGQIEEAKKHFELSKNNAILNNSKGIERLPICYSYLNVCSMRKMMMKHLNY